MPLALVASGTSVITGSPYQSRGPEMAPKPPTFGAPRQSRDAPLYTYRVLRRTEHALELLPGQRRRRPHSRILLDVGDGLHAHQRGADPRRGAYELQRALGVGREPRQVLGHDGRQVP